MTFTLPPRIPNGLTLLDVCCKQGTTSYGYYLAGFDIVGVDREPGRAPRVGVTRNLQRDEDGRAHSTNSASSSSLGNTRSRVPLASRSTTSSIPIDA